MTALDRSPIETRELLITCRESAYELFDAECRLDEMFGEGFFQTKHRGFAALIKRFQSEGQERIARFERVFTRLETPPRRHISRSIIAMVAAGEIRAHQTHKERLRDLALLEVLLRIKHYCIAGYDLLIAMADTLKKSETSRLLTKSYEEEVLAVDGIMSLGEDAFMGNWLSRAQLEDLHSRTLSLESESQKHTSEKTGE